MGRTRFLASLAVAAALPLGAGAQTLTYPDFSDVSQLQLNGSASQQGTKLRLTPAEMGQGGSAWSLQRILLQGNSSFSTVFSFEILGRGGLGNGADGLTFAVQTAANNVGGAGGGIGYAGIPNSVAVEFDTFDNGEFGGSNHVGINTNGNMGSLATTTELTPDFDDGGVWWAWVDYNGETDVMEVRWARSAVRPVGAMLSHTLDLPSILARPDVFVGFTSGTGLGYGEHNILSWNFVNRFVDDGAPPPTVVPEPGTVALTAAGLALVSAFARRRTARG